MRRLEQFLDLNTKITLLPGAGAYIGKCVREALILALEENTTVEFIFNGALFTIRPNLIISSIKGIGIDERPPTTGT